MQITSQPNELTAGEIKAEAARLGFCALGVASATADEQMTVLLSRRPRPPFVGWQPDCRCRPQAWLPGARSVLVGAYPYHQRYSRQFRPGQGHISPFAQEPDYHHLVFAKLELLGRFLQQVKPGVNYIIQVDSGPGCERLFALKAGVGWQGKNNFVIVPGHGSLVWLGLLTTDLELPPDQPLPSQCGDCDLCLRACPTGAYAAANDFDHDRCMSYWASRKEEPSREQARFLSKHGIIYGCDFCQLPCPHNRLTGEDTDSGPALAELLKMPRREFEKFFKQTAAGWRGYNVLKRNVILAAAGRPELREMLERLAEGEDIVSKYARVILGCPGDE